MKKGAYFLNVGRGSAVVTDALCDAGSGTTGDGLARRGKREKRS